MHKAYSLTLVPETWAHKVRRIPTWRALSPGLTAKMPSAYTARKQKPNTQECARSCTRGGMTETHVSQCSQTNSCQSNRDPAGGDVGKTFQRIPCPTVPIFPPAVREGRRCNPTPPERSTNERPNDAMGPTNAPTNARHCINRVGKRLGCGKTIAIAPRLFSPLAGACLGGCHAAGAGAGSASPRTALPCRAPRSHAHL